MDDGRLDRALYESLRRHGATEEKAARIAGGHPTARRPLEDAGWYGSREREDRQLTKQELQEAAAAAGVDGWDTMTKAQLAAALEEI